MTTLVLLSAFTIGLVCVPYLVLGAAFVAKARSRARQEGDLTTAHAPSDRECPPVLVQIPCFNEEAFVERAVRALRGLDWPRARLRVQILDDSTDATTVLAARAATAARDAGYDVAVVHRETRSGYKAGALRNGLEGAGESLVAILDVDFEPPADWLRKAASALAARPDAAWVQFRIDFANRDANWATRAQAMLSDGQNGVEQTGRAMLGVLVPFGGTAGVWRREAIDRAGGWSDNTIAEDMDLSYRAAEQGWSGVYLGFHAVEGQLPDSVGAWRTQQMRWSTGGAQVLSAVLGRLVRTPPHRWRRGVLWSILIHLVELVYAPLTALGLVLLAGRAAAGHFAAPEVALALAVYLAGSLRLFWFPLAAAALMPGPARPVGVLRDLPGAVYLGLRLALVKAAGLAAALSGGGRHFDRTPKRSTDSTVERKT